MTPEPVTQKSQWNAQLYDDKHSFVWKRASGLIELLDAKPGERILDLGCGTGHLTAHIAGAGAEVVGADASPNMIQQAREKYPALKFEVMDVRELHFAEPFDAVFSNATLHWIKEPSLVVAGIAKSLRPGGRFVAEFGGHGNVRRLVEALAGAWTNLRLPGSVPNPWYYPGIAEYSTLLEQHGLEVTYAALFDRPTPLEDGVRGLRLFLEMFGGAFLEPLSSEQRQNLMAAVEEEARPHLWRDDQWILDYRRLRVVAWKR